MCPSVSKIDSQLSALTFTAKSWHNDACSQNGLPLTPNSISILGRFQFLKSIDHRNLTQYLDVLRGKHERTVVVAEHFGSALTDVRLDIQSDRKMELILKILFHCADGIHHIHENEFVHHNLEPSNILVDENFNVKLFNYGLWHMTRGDDDEQYISFPIGNIRYLAPERMLGNHGNTKSDIWSLGLVICELVFEISFWINMKFSQIVRKVLSYNSGSVIEKIAREHNCLEKYNDMNEDLKSVLGACLSFSSCDRPTAAEILKSKVFNNIQDKLVFNPKKKNVIEMSPIERLELRQVYYLWQLTGGDVQAELKKEGLIRSEAPILTIPRLFCLQNAKMYPVYKSQSSLFDHRVVILNTNNLCERLSFVPRRAFYPVLSCPRLPNDFGIEMQSLPLVIRERNIEYQFYRIVLFERLLKAYPFSKNLIVEQAKIDIPPLLRGRIWACLLNALPNGKYEKIDKVTPTPTDRQIEVDIPRCHQYDDFLSSPTGHFKLKRLLKAWVTAHPQYVYWQGLDSLTAPFLISNFNDEEIAFLSLYNFIPKYLHNFFLKDNSIIIKEYLTKFSQLVMFHEPALAKHLNTISFIPELFAIPWVLTMFSHVFPLHKILHLWDKLILGDSSYPLFIGIAILKQLKTTLMESGFNECILLFSDLPDIVIGDIVNESQEMYDKTPKSVCYRKHVMIYEEPEIYDITNVELIDLQREISPRISANDLVNLLKQKPNGIIVFDLRPQNEFKRWHIRGSLNFPFTNLMLGDRRLESIGMNYETFNDKLVVIISVSHENACLFAEFLVDCNISMVSILHNSVNTLHSILPSTLIGS